MTWEKAVLSSGQTIEYSGTKLGEGGMKRVYKARDGASVICFFKDKATSADPQRRARLEAILGKYNPTQDVETGEYWKHLFCWPIGIVTKPELGVVVPMYPKDYYFASGEWKGKEKEGRWFSSLRLRRLLPDSERGNWLSYLQICICIARAVRRLHAAGLAHSDLSNKNVLVDPTSGQATVIDIDSLVVPNLFAPDVIGTPGYIAPEVMACRDLAIADSKKVLPSIQTDQHALAVLIYEYLLNRHPLRGPQVLCAESPEQDEFLCMGPKALFIENGLHPMA